jgi:hypothetical protein
MSHALRLIHPADRVEFFLRFVFEPRGGLLPLGRALLFQSFAARLIHGEHADRDHGDAQKSDRTAEEDQKWVSRALG